MLGSPGANIACKDSRSKVRLQELGSKYSATSDIMHARIVSVYCFDKCLLIIETYIFNLYSYDYIRFIFQGFFMYFCFVEICGSVFRIRYHKLWYRVYWGDIFRNRIS